MFEDTKNIDYIDIFHSCCFGNCKIHWFAFIRYKIIVNAKKYEIEIMFKKTKYIDYINICRLYDHSNCKT